VHVQEHLIYPLAVRWFAEGRLRLANKVHYWMASYCGQRPLDSNLGDFMRRALLFACACSPCPSRSRPSTVLRQLHRRLEAVAHERHRRAQPGQEANGTWDLNFKASMMIASLTEESTLPWTTTPCCRSPTTSNAAAWARPRRRPGLRLEQQEGHRHDRGDAVKMPLNRGMLDKSTYQLALQHDVAAGKKSMSYQVVDDGEVDTYDFRVLGTEKSTPRPARSMRSRSSACAIRPEQAHHRAVVRQGLGLPAGAPAPG
jgi:hypothetical protein